MRLFIAIQLSEEMRASLTGTVQRLKKAGVRGRYAAAQNLHLTLAFLGETAAGEGLASVEQALREAAFPAFPLELSGLGNFGDLPWAGLKDSPGLEAAVREVRGALDRAGIRYDRKKFVPHITLLRNMNGNGDWKSVQPPRGQMTVRRISLMNSELRDGRRVYTELMSVKAHDRADKCESTEGRPMGMSVREPKGE